VIQHERLVWECSGKVDRFGKLVVERQDIVSESSLFQQPDASTKIIAGQEPRGLALDDVPHAAEPRVLQIPVELFACVI
jgi:hypothetical protein